VGQHEHVGAGRHLIRSSEPTQLGIGSDPPGRRGSVLWSVTHFCDGRPGPLPPRQGEGQETDFFAPKLRRADVGRDAGEGILRWPPGRAPARRHASGCLAGAKHELCERGQ
jgi:hypothetical protein